MGWLLLGIQKLNASQQDPLLVVGKVPQTWQGHPDETEIALATLGRACGSLTAPLEWGLHLSSPSNAPRADTTLAAQKGQGWWAISQP